MKKLNRKGFTLIELLAIIVILAIIMVVTVPTVLSSMGDARKNTLKNSVNVVADWIEKEYTMAQLGQADAVFIDVCQEDGSGCASNFKRAVYISKTTGSGYDLSDFNNTSAEITDNGNEPLSGTPTNVVSNDKTKEMLLAAGVDPANYSKIEITITSGRACVKLSASKTGIFKSLDDTDKTVQSTGC